MGRPGIVLKSRFVVPTQKKSSTRGKKFSGYVNYMYRENAQEIKQSTNNDSTKKQNFFVIESEVLDSSAEKFESYLDYMTRNDAIYKHEQEKNEAEEFKFELVAGSFSIDKDRLTKKDLEKVNKKIKQAQKNGSILWQDVVSFDNQYLEEIEVYDAQTHTLDEQRLINSTRKMMASFVNNPKEQLKDPYWFGSIHRNTDNIHVHVGTVELQKNPDREMLIDGQKQFRGRRQQKTIDQMKMSFGRELEQDSGLLYEISELRDRSVNEMRNNLFKLSSHDREKLAHLLEELDQLLPENWEEDIKYKGHAPTLGYNKLDKQSQDKIQEGVAFLINASPTLEKNVADYQALITQQDKKYQRMFGEKENPDKRFKETREKEMGHRLGNAFLKFAGKQKEHQKKIKAFDEQPYSSYSDAFRDGHQYSDYKKYNAIDKFFWKIEQKEARKVEHELNRCINVSKRKALQGYHEMMQDIERKKQSYDYEI